MLGRRGICPHPITGKRRRSHRRSSSAIRRSDTQRREARSSAQLTVVRIGSGSKRRVHERLRRRLTASHAAPRNRSSPPSRTRSVRTGADGGFESRLPLRWPLADPDWLGDGRRDVGPPVLAGLQPVHPFGARRHTVEDGRGMLLQPRSDSERSLPRRAGGFSMCRHAGRRASTACATA
jgi:hypothetical protein